jgi:hypothetical protein
MEHLIGVCTYIVISFNVFMEFVCLFQYISSMFSQIFYNYCYIMNLLFLYISTYLVIIASFVDQISWMTYSIKMYSFVANDRIWGGLQFTSQNRHYHSLLLDSVIVHIEIVFNCQPCHQYGLLVDSIPLCLVVHLSTHFLFLVVVTSFIFARLGF